MLYLFYLGTYTQASLCIRFLPPQVTCPCTLFNQQRKLF